jgi:uncharacterized peroxidase-related enzyme
LSGKGRKQKKEENKMARLAAVNPETAAGRSKELLDGVQRARGMTPNMLRVMAQSPAALEGYLRFAESLARGSLGPKLGEQIALAVAEANRCVYCLSAHTAIGQRAGLNPGEINAARSAASSDVKADAALRFARALIDGRGEVEDSDVAGLRALGYTDGAIAEIIAHVALNVFTNYFNKAADVEVDFPRVEAGDAAVLDGR